MKLPDLKILNSKHFFKKVQLPVNLVSIVQWEVSSHKFGGQLENSKIHHN